MSRLEDKAREANSLKSNPRVTTFFEDIRQKYYNFIETNITDEELRDASNMLRAIKDLESIFEYYIKHGEFDQSFNKTPRRVRSLE